MPLNSTNTDLFSDQQSTSSYFPQQNNASINMTNDIRFSIPQITSTFGEHNLFQPFQEMTDKSNPFILNQLSNNLNNLNDVIHPSLSNPLFYNLTVQSQSNQFDNTDQLAEIMRNPESIQLLEALLQQPMVPSTSSTFLHSPQHKTSAFLMEQQAREAEAHRIQFLNFQALHTHSNDQFMIQSKSSCEVEMLDTLPILEKCDERQNVDHSMGEKTAEATSTLPATNKLISNDGTQVFGVLPQSPYYPTHCMRGTVLQTANDSKKLVETLNVEDFANVSDVATLAHEMNLCIGLVVGLSSIDSSARQSTVQFEIERKLENGDLEISTCELETPVEYPFFELAKRWSSVNPVKTQNLYGLDTRQLEIGDRCIVLTAFNEQSTNNTSQSMNEGRLSPILESNQSSSQLSVSSSTSSRRVSYFCDSNVEMDDHVLI